MSNSNNTINVTCTIQTSRVEFFTKKQTLPEIHIYTNDIPGNDIVKKMQLQWNDFLVAHEYKINYDTATFPKTASLCIDFFTHTQNGIGEWCRMHTAATTISVLTMQEGLKNNPGAPISAKLINLNSNVMVGHVLVSVRGNKMPRLTLSGDPFIINSKINEAVKNNQEKLQHQELTHFFGPNAIEPKDDFLKRVHAPIFNSRVMRMVGFAFFMNENFDADESWFRYWFEVAAKRNNTTLQKVASIVEKQFKRTDSVFVNGFHTVTELIADFVTLPVTVYAYETDFHIVDNKQVSMESFDDLFIREAGDCEDFSRAMLRIFTKLNQIKFKNRKLIEIQRISRLYIPCSMLTKVASNSHGFSIFKNRSAHMYCRLFPKPWFVKNIIGNEIKNIDIKKILDKPSDYKNQGWTEKLRSYVCEGTAPVKSFCALSSMKGEMRTTRQELEIASTHIKCPHKILRQFRPSWSVKSDGFYKTDAHVYTNEFLRFGINVGGFGVLTNTEDKPVYGADCQNVTEMHNINFLPHQILEKNDVTEIKKLLRFEHPPKQLRGPDRNDNWWNNILYNEFEKQLVTNGKKTDLWNDFFVKRPHAVSATDFTIIAAFLKKISTNCELCYEGCDLMSRQIRIRAYTEIK